MTTEQAILIFFVLLALLDGYPLIRLWQYLRKIEDGTRGLLVAFMVENAAVAAMMAVWILLAYLYQTGTALGNAMTWMLVATFVVLVAANWLAYYYLVIKKD